jgi:sporulation protein YlmC with PRC-barrel domain
MIRDVLDKQVRDRNQTKIGKVDGIVMQLRPSGPPRIVFIEIGAVALSGRLGPRIHRLISGLWARFGGEKSREPYRLDWSKVRAIGVDIEFDIDVHDTTIFAWQEWLRKKIICRVPGS